MSLLLLLLLVQVEGQLVLLLLLGTSHLAAALVAKQWRVQHPCHWPAAAGATTAATIGQLLLVLVVLSHTHMWWGVLPLLVLLLPR